MVKSVGEISQKSLRRLSKAICGGTPGRSPPQTVMVDVSITLQ